MAIVLICSSAIAAGEGPETTSEVGALEEWESIEPLLQPPPQLPKSEKPLPRATASSRLPSLENFRETDYEEEIPVNTSPPIGGVLPDERNTLLDRKKQLRLRRIREFRARLLTREREHLNDTFFRDQRGSAELRVCAVNMHGYGLPEDIRRLLPTNGGARRQRRERSALRAAVEANCDVVALQGLVGRSFASASQALEVLRRKLEQESNRPWRGLLGKGVHLLAYSGFLVRGKIPIVELVSHGETLLPRIGSFQEKQFHRSPVELRLQVPGREGRPSRRVVLLNFDLQGSLQTERVESETHRMQMAEGLRQLAIQTIETQPGELFRNDTVVVTLGNQAVSQSAPSAQLLQGRHRLPDFNSDCTLETERLPGRPAVTRAQCAKVRPQVLFNPLVETALPPRRFKRDKESESWKAIPPTAEERAFTALRESARRRHTEGLYVFQTDLELMKCTDRRDPRYVVGAIPIANGLQESALLWMELNW